MHANHHWQWRCLKIVFFWISIDPLLKDPSIGYQWWFGFMVVGWQLVIRGMVIVVLLGMEHDWLWNRMSSWYHSTIGLDPWDSCHWDSWVQSMELEVRTVVISKQTFDFSPEICWFSTLRFQATFKKKNVFGWILILDDQSFPNMFSDFDNLDDQSFPNIFSDVDDFGWSKFSYNCFLPPPKKKIRSPGGMNGLYDQIVALKWIQANIQAIPGQFKNRSWTFYDVKISQRCLNCVKFKHIIII